MPHASEVEHDLRVYSNRFFFRRPRILQYRVRGREVRFVESSSGGELQLQPTKTVTASAEHAVDGLAKQRERIDLFIDLIFVAIVGNLSEHFNKRIFYTDPNAEAASAPVVSALVEFAVLFVSTWRLWNYLRQFGNSFFQDDVIQRYFYLWILMLALVWGNNAPFVFEAGVGGTVALVVFMVVRASFMLAETAYCVFIPWLWRQHLISVGLTVPAAGLWLGAIWARGWLRVGLLMGALVADVVVSALMASPLLDGFLTDGHKKSHDVEHYAGRLEAFLIIVLGEGVNVLCKGSPLGVGITSMTASGVFSLSILFGIYLMYFRGDYSREYVHAMRHRWWKESLWGLAHVILFGSLFLLDVAMLSQVVNGGLAAAQSSAAAASGTAATEAGAGSATSSAAAEPSSTAAAVVARETGGAAGPAVVELHYEARRALWTVSASLAISLFSMTAIALLNKSMDKPSTLMVNHRLLRLLPRGIVAVVTVCLPIVRSMTGTLWLRIEFGLLCGVIAFEWFAGLERGAQLFEPAAETDLSHYPTETDEADRKWTPESES